MVAAGLGSPTRPGTCGAARGEEALTLAGEDVALLGGEQGYAGTGKTAMLNRARALAEKMGWHMMGLGALGVGGADAGVQGRHRE